VQKESNMKRMNVLAALSVVSLLAATTAWAGGASCSGKDADASAKSCKVGTSATMTKAEAGHCDMGKGAMASGKSCTIGANQMVYSFAVPTAECNSCVDGITKALMSQKGISCVHVDLKSRVAYIVADKKMDKNALTKCIATAGYKNKYRGEGNAARNELVKMMTASAEKGATAAKPKEKA